MPVRSEPRAAATDDARLDRLVPPLTGRQDVTWILVDLADEVLPELAAVGQGGAQTGPKRGMQVRARISVTEMSTVRLRYPTVPR